jgi:hypothetical protein
MVSVMSFVAQASVTLQVSAETAFDRLADHPSWKEWMPGSFRPVGRSSGRLHPGSKFRVRLFGAPLPVSIRVVVVDRARELTWGGGVPGILRGKHRFLFEPRGESSVEIRSEETWSGAMSPLLRRVLLPLAERIGREQLAGLERALS